MTNMLLNTDSYKFSHSQQYPPGTTHVSSYIESRGGQFDEVVFFGLQAWIKENLLLPMTKGDVDEFADVAAMHGFEPNVAGANRILNQHGGFWPVAIEAAPEGSVIPTRNVLAQVVNTDPELAWVTSFLETSLLRAVWYPSTVATLSREAKKRIYQGLLLTSDDPDGQIPFKLHDFGARGASSEETAALGGMAHLVNFMGTDTVSGLMAARRYYGAPMAGFSIPASEHSTMTAWGQANETAAYANMLKQFAGDGKMFAMVSDSYDIWNAVSNILGGELREHIITSGGTMVVRPDSGNPVTVPIEVICRLMDVFGYSTNSKGYKVLPNYIRVIQGDGMTLENISHVLSSMEARKLSVDNIAFGMGGGLLQKVDRDTQKFAMKASAAKVGGQWRDVYKDPITDQGKTSKKGRQALVYQCGLGSCGYRTIKAQYADGLPPTDIVMRPVYRNGELLVDDDFEQVRARAKL